MEINSHATVNLKVNGEEAKKELQRVESYAISLKGRLAEAYDANDNKKAKKLEKELRETNVQLKLMRTNARNIDAAMNNIGLATPKELRNLIRDINTKLSSGHVKRGSAEWKQYQEQLKLVNNELKKVKAEAKESQGWLTRFNDGFTKWGALAASTIAGVTGLTFTIRKATDAYAKMEEAEAQVVKYTGMTKQQVHELNEDLKRMDTRTAREKLNALAGDAGRLGISAKEDVLEFVDAADKINVALGEDLGEDAVKNIGKLAMMFGEDRKLGLRGAMLATGSAINEVAQNSSAAEAYLVGFMGRVSGAANQAKVAQGDIIGYASVLDQNMQQQEMAATAFQTLMMKMYQTPAKFAKLAGKNVQEFTALIKEDANEAILQFLETLGKKGGLDKLAPMFKEMKLDGVRAAGVISTMAGKIEDIRAAQKLANDAYSDGTSIINEFNVQNNTVQAGIDKAKKKFADITIELGEKLLPIARYGISTGSLAVKGLKAIIDILSENGVMIASISALWLIYVTRLKLATAYHAVLNTVIKTATTVQGAYRLASIALNDALAGDVRSLLVFARQIRTANVLTKTVAASTMLYRAAVELLTFRLKGATAALKGFAIVARTGIFGLLLTAVTAAGIAWMVFSKRMDAAAKTQRLLNEIQNEATINITAEREEVEALLRVAKDETKTKEERLKAIKRLNEISPEYLGALDLETIGTDKARVSVDNYVKSLLVLAEIEAAKSRLTDTDKELGELKKKQKEYLDERETFWGAVKALPRNMGSMLTFGAVEDTGENLKNEIKELEEQRETLKNFLQEQIEEKVNIETTTTITQSDGDTGGENVSEKEKRRRLKENLKKVEAAAAKEEALIKEKYARGETAYRDYCKAINENDIKELDNKMALYDQESNEYNQLLTKKQDLLRKGLDQENKLTIDEIEDCAKKEEIAWVDAYHNRQISRYALNEALFMLDIAALSDKQALYAKDSKEWYDYERQITDLENREKIRKQEGYQQLLSSIREKYSKKDIDQLMQEEIDGIDYLHENGLLKEEEYQKLLKAVKKKFLKEKIDQVDNPAPDDESTQSFLGGDFQKLKDKYALINEAEEQGKITHQEALQQKAEADAKYLDSLKAKTEAVYSSLGSIVTAYSNYTNACQDLEVAKIEKKYDEEIKAAGNNTVKTKKLEEKKEQEVAKVKSKYNKKAMKMEIAQAFAGMAMSAINAYSSAAEVPLVGYILAPIAATAAVAAGMLQIATIKKQHQAQEAGYYSGGFTPLGDPKKEVGVVHANEFVANHSAVNNPNVLPVLRLIDYAQKNNTIGSLTAEDISMSLNKGYSHTAASTPSTASGENTAMLLGVVSNTLDRASDVIEQLSEKLNERIESYVTIDGEHGFEKQYNHYKKLKANKSR